MIILSHTNLSGINLGGINLSEIKLGMPSGKGTGGEETFDPASFDQAWSVTGKTNDDEDRATVKNLTGNGNDLVLSNFAFAEDSGYGLYAYNFNSFNLKDNVVKPTEVKKDSFRIIGTGNNSNVIILSNVSNSADWKIRITGMKEGDSCLVGNANKSGDYIKITKDGTYTYQKQYEANSTNGLWYNSSQETDVLVEQIPDYEGYLVTDGVDDKIQSSSFELDKDWTMVGNWVLLQGTYRPAGVVKSSILYIYNNSKGMAVYLKSGSISNVLSEIKSLYAVCSDGRVYDNNWNEHQLAIGEESKNISNLRFGTSTDGAKFTKIAFKNSAIYNGKVLTKDQCISAYNYLQTLKEK